MEARNIREGMTIGIFTGKNVGQRILVRSTLIADENNLAEIEQLGLNGQGAIQLGSILVIGLGNEKKEIGLVLNPSDEVNLFFSRRTVQARKAPAPV